MAERSGYLAGVPCWVDTNQPDPEAAATFYGGLFGWEFADVAPADSSDRYLVARLRGGDVGAVASVPAGAPPAARWNTYLWVEGADAAAARVQELGGKVLIEPFDVGSAGRMAVCTDPEGAAFCLWEAKEHRGARIVNEHGAVVFNTLHSRDLEGAQAFYGGLFGWETLGLGGPGGMWTLPGYGEFLEGDDPGLRRRVAESGAPDGFADVVAALEPLAGDGATPARWSVTFAVDDADAIATRAAELGGEVKVPPTDAPWVRFAVIADPQGATFTASQFVPENQGLEGSQTAASSG
ncbi:MAG: VOC family protein [Actinobacteria bacterium]|nr:VOC family protein [Actinomycetota bacterium]